MNIKVKKDLPNYSIIQTKVREIFEDASSQILSNNKPVIVSDCEERGANLVDGTDSEWWTEKDSAWIEVDLQSFCFISGLEIRWWGTSVSSNITLLALNRDENEFVAVKTSKDATKTPTDINGWTHFPGWEIPTCKIKLELRDGSLDPWGMNKYFGIRQIIVKGRYMS